MERPRALDEHPTVTNGPLEDAVRRHGPWLLRWFGRRWRTAEAEDLTQETLLAFVRGFATLRSPERAAAYVLETAKRIDAAAKRRSRPLALFEEPIANGPSDDGRRAAALDRALASLPIELEQAIDVYYSRRLTYEEAARLLDIPRATFQSRLRRALEELRQSLPEEEP